MKVKCVNCDRSVVHERILLNAGMSMVVAVLVPHVSRETLHAAFHVITNRPIILALFPEACIAFSLLRSFSTVKARSTDCIAFHRRCGD